VFAWDCPSPFGRWMSITAGEFVNESLINYCLTHGIELTRSRPLAQERSSLD